jgi:uncharacterized protein (TIGR03083 family)
VHVQARTAANRRLLADFFDNLDDHQLATRSLCSDWSVRDVLGHLVATVTGSVGGLLREVVRARGSLDRANAAAAQRTARRPVPELTAVLRDRADEHGKAPGVGPMGQLTDGCVHLRDCARPLGLTDDVEPGDWRLVLDRLPRGVPGLVPRKRVVELTLRATDQAWTWGSGAEVSGPSEALAMAVAGRAVALDDLTGPGVPTLRARLGGRG